MSESSSTTVGSKYLPAKYLPSRHTIGVLEGLFVAFLWSSSYVLIKLGLKSIPALTFAGLRYILAVGVLVPFVLRSSSFGALKALSLRDWFNLILLGIVWYALTPGSQYLGLKFLPAVTVSMLINFAPIVVALSGMVLLGESLTREQWGGIGLYLVGLVIYFLPASLGTTKLVGLAIMIICVLSNAGSTVLGRYVNHDEQIPSVVVTFVSMAVGAIALLAGGLTYQGLPTLSINGWGLVVVLAVVNTALAYTLWNRALQVLTAVEASIILSTILVQVAVFGWVFLGEAITLREGVGLFFVGIGTLIVQFRKEAH
jgi:drug/metabolite transporter (DMT)-like permease